MITYLAVSSTYVDESRLVLEFRSVVINHVLFFFFQDLLRILYVGENTEHLQAEGERGEAAGADGKAGIRVLGISPDGQHLAAGDRCGNLR